MPNMSTQVLGQFTTGMDRSSRRGGKDGARRLWTLQNAYLNERGEAVPRPGLQHVASVPNSAGLYGWQGQLHVFHGDEDYVDPGNPLVVGHWVRYPLPLMYLDGSLPDGMVGENYSASLLVRQGVTPYQWKLTAGALPAGLHLDASSGVVSGIPTTAGSFTVTLAITDHAGRTASSPQSISVGLSASLLSANPTGLAVNDGQNVAFALGQQLTEANVDALAASDQGARLVVGLTASPWVETYTLVGSSYVKDAPAAYSGYASLADIVAISRDGTWLCVGGNDSWKVAHDDGSGTFSTIATHAVIGSRWTAAFSAAHDYLAHSGSGTAMQVYRIVGTALTELTLPTIDKGLYAHDVAWHHGGLLAVAENQLLAVLTVIGTSVTVTARYDDVVTSVYYNVAWSPDGTHLYTLVDDNGVAAVRVFGWDGSTLTRLADAPAPGGAVVGHSTHKMALSHQGSVLVVITTTGPHAYLVSGASLSAIALGGIPTSTAWVTFQRTTADL